MDVAVETATKVCLQTLESPLACSEKRRSRGFIYVLGLRSTFWLALRETAGIGNVWKVSAGIGNIFSFLNRSGRIRRCGFRFAVAPSAAADI